MIFFFWQFMKFFDSTAENRFNCPKEYFKLGSFFCVLRRLKGKLWQLIFRHISEMRSFFKAKNGFISLKKHISVWNGPNSSHQKDLLWFYDFNFWRWLSQNISITRLSHMKRWVFVLFTWFAIKKPVRQPKIIKWKLWLHHCQKWRKKFFFSFFCEKSSGGAGSIIVQENKLCQPSTLIHHQVNASDTHFPVFYSNFQIRLDYTL